MAKKYHPSSSLSVVSKVFDKLVNNRFVDHLEKCSLFLFPVWFRSFLSIAGLLTVVFYRISRALIGLGATRAITFDISKVIDRVWHTGFLHKLKFNGISVYINDLPGDAMCNIATYANDTTLYSKFDQAFDLWQQLWLA